MIVYSRGWRLQQTFAVPALYQPQVSISIIIPARNEAANIKACLLSILSQNYPSHLFEVIVVDDHSEDDTVAIVKEFKEVVCLSLQDDSNAHKKKALAAGIAQSKGELIVTTDADCIASTNWLIAIAAKYEQSRPVMLIAPVNYATNNSLLGIFQSLDFMSMQGITAAAHKLHMGNMCNGANLAFGKEAFYAVKGYEGIDNLASGDDYLLLMKLQKRYPGRIGYIRSTEAIIQTPAQPTWSDFLQQRIRWASKSGKYNDTKLTAILILVYLFNVIMGVLAIKGFFDPAYWTVLLLMLASKILIELYFLLPVAEFFKKKNELGWFPLLQPLHILYIILAGCMGYVGVYKWKGRVTK